MLNPLFKDYKTTCSINNPKDWALTFARTREYLVKLQDCAFNLGVCVPLDVDAKSLDLSPDIKFFPLDHFEYHFTRFHNEIHRGKKPKPDIIGGSCDIHHTVIVGEGIRVTVGPGGVKEQLRHVGNVIFGSRVYVGPFTLIQRGTFDSTVIGDGCKIDNHVTIGHNSIIGQNVVFATGAVLGGSVKIGSNSWIGLNSTIKNGVSICERVVIGAGAIVVKDITESGIYAGNPARKINELKEEWNF